MLLTAGGRITCQQCSARSKRTKQQCRAPAMKGKKVCRILAVYLGAQLLKQVDYDVPQQRLSIGLMLGLTYAEENQLGNKREDTRGRKPTGYRRVTRIDELEI